MAKEEEERPSEERIRWDRFIPYCNCTEEDFRPTLTGTRAVCKYEKKKKKKSFLQVWNVNYYQPWAGPEERYGVPITFKWSINCRIPGEWTSSTCQQLPGCAVTSHSCRGPACKGTYQSHRADLAGGWLFPGETGACFVRTGWYWK